MNGALTSEVSGPAREVELLLDAAYQARQVLHLVVGKRLRFGPHSEALACGDAQIRPVSRVEVRVGLGGVLARHWDLYTVNRLMVDGRGCQESERRFL